MGMCSWKQDLTWNHVEVIQSFTSSYLELLGLLPSHLQCKASCSNSNKSPCAKKIFPHWRANILLRSPRSLLPCSPVIHLAISHLLIDVPLPRSNHSRMHFDELDNSAGRTRRVFPDSILGSRTLERMEGDSRKYIASGFSSNRRGSAFCYIGSTSWRVGSWPCLSQLLWENWFGEVRWEEWYLWKVVGYEISWEVRRRG